MEHIKLFEEFVNEPLNEGKWRDFEPEKIAKAFMKDVKPSEGSIVTNDDLANWMDLFAQHKRFKWAIPYDLAKDVIDILKKRGYKNLDVDKILTE
jgi:hypothetical protein